MIDPATTQSRRYLDNAATSWPKPEAVWQAWEQVARHNGAAAGRGGYREAIAAGQIIGQARSAVASMLGVPAERVALPMSATLGLNQAIHGLVRPGDHVIATAADHNATLRPLAHLAAAGQIELTIVPCDGGGWVDPEEIAQAWRSATRLVTMSQASNVTGVLQDAESIVQIAHERSGQILVDASQTFGQVPITEGVAAADVLVAPAHKWLLGMHGVAVVAVREGVTCEPLILGGTGSASESLTPPLTLADQFEAGTPDLPAAAALVAAIDWQRAKGTESLAAFCVSLTETCRSRLADLSGVQLVGADREQTRGLPIISFTVTGYSPAEVAALLEQIAGVQARSGLHCAAAVHEYLGTAAAGTVRLAFGPFNTSADVDAVVSALTAIIQ
jgi:cysteine desulfurase/selenocysteine lyase